MQKLKLFLLFFVATVAACNFTSCKDDDNVSSAIVGTWIGGDEYGGTYTLTFLADGRFSECWTWDGRPESDSGRYTYDGNTLTMIFDDGYNESISGVVVSGDTLIIQDLRLVRQ